MGRVKKVSNKNKTSLKIIDAHQHFWLLSRGDYDFLSPENSCLYKNFLPKDLNSMLETHNILGTVLIQAAPSINETLYLFNLIKNESIVKGIVGWIDTTKESSLDDLKVLSKNALLKGIRVMLQDLQDKQQVISTLPNRKIVDQLVKTNMTLDCLINRFQIREIFLFAKKWNNLPIIIDHCGKPNLDIDEFDIWSNDIKKISTLPNVYIKVSGLFTQSQKPFCRKNIEKYILHAIECFGINRVVWGSDWPVLTSHGSYDDWLNLCKDIIISHISEGDAQLPFYENAVSFYKLVL